MPEAENTQDLEPQGGVTDGVQAQQETQPQEQEIPSNEGAEQAAAQEIAAPEALTNKDLWDALKGQLKTDETLEELNRQTKRAEDLRQKLSKNGQLPKEAAEYEITPAEGLQDIIDVKAEIFGDIKELAFKNHMSKEQLNGFINGYMQLMLDKGLVQKPLSEQEAKEARAAYVAEQKKRLGAQADTMIQSAVNFIEAQYRKGVLDEGEKAALMRLADRDAAGISALNKLREMAGGPVVPVDNAQTDGLPPDRELVEKWDTYSESEKLRILQQRQKLGRPKHFAE